MNVLVLDTETTSLDKPFCYDCSWVIMNTESGELIDLSANVIEQVWHNLPLFESSYYKEKRPKYITMMRNHSACMDKWGYVMKKLARVIRQYNITDVYAYNSDFDDKVIAFNCDWYKCNNPLETVAIHDIWGYASAYVTGTEAYKAFCETHSRFTDTGNYKGSAEVVYQYLTNNPDFIEEHMGLFDSEIEAQILLACVQMGAYWGEDLKVNKILPRMQETPFTVKVNGKELYQGKYVKKYVRNGTYSFTTL